MKIVEGFRLREVMGQATLVGEGIEQVNFNKLVILNASATYLWQSVADKEFAVDDLARLLVDRYGIAPDRALHDASRITEEWIANGIIKQ